MTPFSNVGLSNHASSQDEPVKHLEPNFFLSETTGPSTCSSPDSIDWNIVDFEAEFNILQPATMSPNQLVDKTEYHPDVFSIFSDIVSTNNNSSDCSSVGGVPPPHVAPTTPATQANQSYSDPSYLMNLTFKQEASLQAHTVAGLHQHPAVQQQQQQQPVVSPQQALNVGAKMVFSAYAMMPTAHGAMASDHRVPLAMNSVQNHYSSFNDQKNHGTQYPINNTQQYAKHCVLQYNENYKQLVQQQHPQNYAQPLLPLPDYLHHRMRSMPPQVGTMMGFNKPGSIAAVRVKQTAYSRTKKVPSISKCDHKGCQRTFNKKSQKEIHMRTHTGEHSPTA